MYILIPMSNALDTLSVKFIIAVESCKYDIFRSEKFFLFVDNELLNPAIFIFIKIFLIDSGKLNVEFDF